MKSIKNKNSQKKIIIGWNEDIDLPEFDIWDLPAKVDTGAKTSSLHVEDIEELPNGYVKFSVVVDDRKPERHKIIKAKLLKKGVVRTSHLYKQNRLFIKTKLNLGPVTRNVELNLMDRSDLRYRFILGRTALKKHFLIDAEKSRILNKK